MIKLICVAGPTGSGKTAFAIKLAEELNGEIISADSMQIYKSMDIGTAKPKEDEKKGIVHHLIDIVSPYDEFSVKEFTDMAKKIIDDIVLRGKTSIIAGGTGLFINSLIDNVSFSEGESDEKLREELTLLAKEHGNHFVHEMLKEFDYDSYLRLHPNNLKRVIRAIEIYKTTGITMTEQIKSSKNIPSPYDVTYFGLNAERDYIYERIDKRVDIMLENGLEKEVRDLYEKGLDLKYKSMQAIGYKELIMYFEGKLTFEEAVDKIKQESRRYAKRQLTWFRKDERIKWIDILKDKDCEEQYEYVRKMGYLREYENV